MNLKLSSLALFGLAALLGACAMGTGDAAEQTTESADDELSASSRSYVSLRFDNRKCMSPLCGGYWVRDLNRKTAERYVSGLDFAPSGLDDIAIGKVLEANPEDLVLRVKLSKKDPKFGTQSLLVYEAYRGMPGIVPAAGDVFYRAEDRTPHISCFTAPCPNLAATKINATAKTYFDGFNVEHASAPFVDQEWLIERVNHHNAIVAASFVNGDKFPGGYAKLLDASQVYVRIDDMSGPCPAFKLMECAAGTVRPWTKDNNLCQFPGECVAANSCPSLQPPHCADGYSVSGATCLKPSCDPTFVVSQQ